MIGPDDDHVCPAGGAGVALQASADGDVVRYNCTGSAKRYNSCKLALNAAQDDVFILVKVST